MSIDEVLALLYARFPKTFIAHQVRRRPLKIGISHDLAAVLGDSVERKHLGKALAYYTGNPGYLRAQQAGAERIDLDGNPVGIVAEDEARHAASVMAERKKRAREKKKPLEKNSLETKKPEPKRDGLAALRKAAERQGSARRQGARRERVQEFRPFCQTTASTTTSRFALEAFRRDESGCRGERRAAVQCPACGKTRQGQQRKWYCFYCGDGGELDGSAD